VLVVDAHPVVRETLCAQLAEWGCETTEADDGPAALDELEQAARAGTPFKLVLIDRDIPGLSGTGLARMMRQHPLLGGTDRVLLVPLLHLGGMKSRDKKDFTTFLTKPVTPSRLQKVVGACFSADAAASSMNYEPRPDEPEPKGPSCRVLVTEDNPVNQQVARKILENAGHVVTVVSTGKETLEALDRGDFHVIFMDLMMPDMDGAETVRCIRVREDARGRHTPIIALTAKAMKGDREKCLASGMDDYLAKPFKARDLIRAVRRWADPALSPSS
jgi:CheY-like chemotaxis protein